jgi:hypothetical protein
MMLGISSASRTLAISLIYFAKTPVRRVAIITVI